MADNKEPPNVNCPSDKKEQTLSNTNLVTDFYTCMPSHHHHVGAVRKGGGEHMLSTNMLMLSGQREILHVSRDPLQSTCAKSEDRQKKNGQVRPVVAATMRKYNVNWVK